MVRPGSQAAVFDIDGTLTTSDRQLVRQIVLGADPKPYKGAAALTRAWASAGYLIVYITARPYFLRPGTLVWLGRHRFAPGPLLTTETVGAAMPGASDAGQFKTRTLRRLKDGPRLVIAAAYGNAVTDICAYASVGIPASRTFIIGPNAGKSCGAHPPPRSISGYVDHLRQLGVIAPARPLAPLRR